MEETENTIKAKEKLEKISGYPVVIKTLDELAIEYNLPNIRGYLGSHDFNGKEHIIGVNSNKPETNEASFIHECIHGIMDAEGYPSVVYYNQNISAQDKTVLQMLASYLSSAIHHPEVYRRMTEDYTIDMKTYFAGLLIQKINRFEKKPKEINNPIDKAFSTQQDIIDGHEYFFYDSNSRNDILNQLKINSESAYDFLLGLQKAKLDFYSADTCRVSATLFANKVIKYGEKKIGPILTQRFWNKIEIK